MATAEERYREFLNRMPGGGLTMPSWEDLPEHDRERWKDPDDEEPRPDTGATEKPT